MAIKVFIKSKTGDHNLEATFDHTTAEKYTKHLRDQGYYLTRGREVEDALVVVPWHQIEYISFEGIFDEPEEVF